MSADRENQRRELLDRTAEAVPLSTICRDPHMPGRSSVYEWLADEPEFAARFEAARLIGIEKLVEECIDIADDKSDDVRDVDGRAVPNSEFIARSRVRIDTRLRLAGMWNPAKYSEKRAIELTGKGGGPVETLTRIELVAVEPDGDGTA